MKKIVSLLLVLVMCAALFAGCGNDATSANTNPSTSGNPTVEDNGLAKAKEFLFSMYKDNRGTETAIDYNVVSSVIIGKTSYPITWSFEITSGDGSCLSVETGASLTTIKVEKNYSGAVVEYNLVGTISDGNGKTETVKFAHSVPMSKKVASLADGTYVISTNGLSMAGMAEDKTYGYPTANEVTDTSFTAVDIVTITNVTGGLTIQDCYGRYYYLKGTYNSFNLSDTMPEEGHIFELQVNDDGSYALVNVQMQKTLAYSASYSSWGCYSTLGDGYMYSLKIVNADASSAHTHTEETIPGKAATCTEDGLTEGKKCTECGAILTEQQTIAAAHTWGEWTVTKEATVTAEGEKVRTCTVCGEKETKSVEYKATEWVVATAPEAGKAYKFGLFHGGQGEVDVYFNGENYNSYAWYLAFTKDVAGAVDTYVEAVDGVEGAYRLYFKRGEDKVYIRTYPRDGDTTKGTLELTTTVPAEYYTWNAERNTLIYTSTTGQQFYMGSSGTYSSISVSSVDYISNANSYVSHLYFEQEVETDGALIADGQYTLSTEGVYANSKGTDVNYGYLPSSNTASAFTITNVEGGVTIQDEHGRYMYVTGTYNSFNFAKEAPAEGHVFSVTKNDDGTFTFVSLLNGKTLGYGEGIYTTWGVYGEDKIASVKSVNITVTAFVA